MGRSEKLKCFLQKSFLEFNIILPSIQESIFKKHSMDLDKNKLASLELFESDGLVASALSSDQEFYSNCRPLELSFSTEVIVQPQYRRRGHLGNLIEFAEEIDERNSSLASIVIARKKVGKFYSNYGFIEFGVFPNIVFEKHHEEGLPLAGTSVDWENVSVAYEKPTRTFLLVYVEVTSTGNIQGWKSKMVDILSALFDFEGNLDISFSRKMNALKWPPPAMHSIPNWLNFLLIKA